MFAIIANITQGNRREVLEQLGIDLSKNTYTEYIKYVGIVCSEYNERQRRSTRKWLNSQWDEVAFGGR